MQDAGGALLVDQRVEVPSGMTLQPEAQRLACKPCTTDALAFASVGSAKADPADSTDLLRHAGACGWFA